MSWNHVRLACSQARRPIGSPTCIRLCTSTYSSRDETHDQGFVALHRIYARICYYAWQGIRSHQERPAILKNQRNASARAALHPRINERCAIAMHSSKHILISQLLNITDPP